MKYIKREVRWDLEGTIIRDKVEYSGMLWSVPKLKGGHPTKRGGTTQVYFNIAMLFYRYRRPTAIVWYSTTEKDRERERNILKKFKLVEKEM